MLDWFPENESVLDEARELLSKCIENLGEDEEIPALDWGKPATSSP
jgi:hypothetical protein